MVSWVSCMAVGKRLRNSEIMMHAEQVHQQLSLDHFRHSEECAVRIGCVLQCDFLGERLAQSLRHILSTGVCKSLAALLGFVDAVSVRYLRHWFDVRRVEFVEPFD